MKTKTSKYCIVLLLILIFAAPGLTAYLFYTHPSWLGSTRTNKGILLVNPVQLTSLDKTDKWTLMLWAPTQCKKQCLKQLDVLARVRLALGRRLYQVNQMLLLGKKSAAPTKKKWDMLQSNDFKIKFLSATDAKRLAAQSKKPQIFIINPDNYLVLSYKSVANPDDVYKDLKLLLNTTETN